MMDALTVLSTRLSRLGVPAIAYSIGVDSDEAYCLVRMDDGWHVYYSERGSRSVDQTFSDVESAGEALVRRLLGDGTVRSLMGAAPSE